MDAWKVKIFTEFCIYLGYGYLDLDDKDLLCFYEECLIMAEYLGNISNRAHFYLLLNVGILYKEMNQFSKALQFSDKAIRFTINIGYKKGEALAMRSAGNVLCSLSKYQEAIEYYKKSMNATLDIGDKGLEGTNYIKLGNAYHNLNKYMEAIKHYEKSLNIALELGNKSLEEKAYGDLGNVYQVLGKFMEAIKNYKKSLNIALEIGDKSAEGRAYSNLGMVYQLLGKYMEAIKHNEKSLNIALEIGDKSLEGKAYGNLGNVYQSLGKYMEAIKHNKKSLNIALELGEKSREGETHCSLGNVYQSLGKYMEAIKHHEKSLNIAIEIGDKNGEGIAYGNLGNLYHSFGKYTEAIKHHETSLNIALEIGYKNGEGIAYGNLGNVYQSLGKYMEAFKHHKKRLNIALELGDKSGEGTAYGNLGNVYQSLGKYMEAIKHYEKSLNIALEIGDKSAEGKGYGNLGNVYKSLGKYMEAINYYEKSLNIALELGNKSAEGIAYCNLGNVYQLLGKYMEASKHHENSLNIALEIGDKSVEGIAYGSLGDVFYLLGKCQDAVEYYEKCLRVATEIGSKYIEAEVNYKIGLLYYSLNPRVNSTEYDGESCKNTLVVQSVHHLKESVRCWEYVFEHSHEQDDSKISIVDTFIHAYKLLTTVLIETNQTEEALLVCDRGRARALGDTLMSKYGIDKEHALRGSTLEYPDVTKMLSKNNFSILFFAVEDKVLNTWVISSQTPLFFATSKNKENMTLHKVINESFDKIKVGQMVRCENRSLESRSENVKLTQDGHKGVKFEASLVVRDRTPAPVEETQGNSHQDRDPLEKLFNILIAPVLQELEQEEIVIIPDGPLYTVPFAALRDPNTGQLLSETKRIRLAPSLAALKTLQECPSDYHCKKGALIVGDPAVGEVMLKGEKACITRLPSAMREAEIIGKQMDIQPLIGSEATKEMVKQKLQEGVSIIHIAAHGDSEYGHIALAPPARTEDTSIPKDEDYMLTMQEVQEIGVKAQLVVLSCCHSGRGEIRSEGIVGMSRAFLAAGARAVVASLWAIDDDATLSFMISFYMCLKMGQSASKSLQQAMKELREEGYSKPRHWAPFFLIGDDVTISV